MVKCPNCETDIEEGKKFCRNCGQPMPGAAGEAATWRLPPPDTRAQVEPPRATMPVAPGHTAPANQPPAYVEPPKYVEPPAYGAPMNYYPAPAPPAPYQQPVEPEHANISIGNWLSEGWQVYKENWLLMTLATLLGGFLTVVTAGILGGPMLMGLYRMAFRTLRGERPQLGDLFNWEGRFLQSFLAFLIISAIYGGVAGIGQGSAVSGLLSLVITPILTIVLALVIPLMLDRKMDVATALNTIVRLIFSRDWLMWWVVGLVFSTIIAGGLFGCLVGVLVTTPWIISSATIAYRDVFAMDDPNRTLP
jgi:hypothetical protein